MAAYIAADIPPARVGDSLSDVDTPAALLDMDAVDDNILLACALVREAATARGVPVPTLRPHFKAHKCTQLAQRQIDLSGGMTTGVCCQKVCEAEACVAAGITDVYVCNQVVAPSKVARLVALAAGGAKVGIAVDSEDNVRALSAAASAAQCTLRVLVELEVGCLRCGVTSHGALVALAQLITALPALTFGGIHAYNGYAQHTRTHEGRVAAAEGVARDTRAAVAALAAEGVACPLVTGGGSGTFVLDAGLGALGELQAGSYVLTECNYGRNLDEAGAQLWTEWAHGLTLLATVCSRREGSWVVVDAGLKAQSTDCGPPVVLATAAEYASACAGAAGGAASGAAAAGAAGSGGRYRPLRVGPGPSYRYESSVGALTVRGVSDEHTTLIPSPGEQLPEAGRVGEKLVLLFGHCDPGVNHFDWLVAHRKGKVEGLWRLTSRSPGI
jgi:3-hydroxy-D-aspartate aldolase